MPSFTLALAGDVVAIREQREAGAQAPVYEQLRTADLAVGNFEMALTPPGVPLEKTGVRCADPSIAPSLALLGFDVLSVANNHTVDYGWPGLESTITALRASGCAVIGAGPTLAQACRPSVHDVHGVKVGVLAFSCLTPVGARATATRPGIAVIGIDSRYEVDPLVQAEEPGDPSSVRIHTSARPDDLAQALDHVRALKSACDRVVVTLHWGFGSGETLADYQRPLAHALVDAGADVVHGHHPHALHAVGLYRGCPIFYSAGTFMAEQFFLPATPVVEAMRRAMSKDGYVAQLSFGTSGVREIRLHPTVLDHAYRPVPASGADLARIAARLARLSAPHGVRIHAVGDALAVEPLGESLPEPESEKEASLCPPVPAIP